MLETISFFNDIVIDKVIIEDIVNKEVIRYKIDKVILLYIGTSIIRDESIH